MQIYLHLVYSIVFTAEMRKPFEMPMVPLLVRPFPRLVVLFVLPELGGGE